jgi:hypothetical protein
MGLYVQLGQFCAGVADPLMMKTIHIDPAEGNAEQQISTIREAIEGLLDSDKAIAVTVADEDSMLSPQQAAAAPEARQRRSDGEPAGERNRADRLAVCSLPSSAALRTACRS